MTLNQLRVLCEVFKYLWRFAETYNPSSQNNGLNALNKSHRVIEKANYIEIQLSKHLKSKFEIQQHMCFFINTFTASSTDKQVPMTTTISKQ